MMNQTELNVSLLLSIILCTTCAVHFEQHFSYALSIQIWKSALINKVIYIVGNDNSIFS